MSNPSFAGKITSIFSQISIFSNKTIAENSPGLLFIYNIITSHSGEFHFELLHRKALSSEVSSINFYEGNNILFVGMNNGNISINKIYINESSRITRELVEDKGILKAHKHRVVGACINYSIGYIYSIAREKTLNISEVNYQSFMKSIPISKKELSGLVHDESLNRLFLSDDAGSVWIIDLQKAVNNNFYIQA
jgi:hypothetical protein